MKKIIPSSIIKSYPKFFIMLPIISIVLMKKIKIFQLKFYQKLFLIS